MKGVILAGGLGTRLYPLTHATNKHLLPVYNQPMIYYPIQTLRRAGIDDILIVIGGPHAGDFSRVLENSKAFGIKHLEFAMQATGDGGIADALSLAEDWADGGSIAVILGDNCTDADIKTEVENFRDGALIFTREVPDPDRFGIVEFDHDDPSRIVSIVEKPKEPKSNFAVVGLYLYDNNVFDNIRQIKPSSRGQLEITDVNNIYISTGSLRAAPLKGFWSDAGTFDSLYRTSVYWARKVLGREAERKLTDFKNDK